MIRTGLWPYAGDRGGVWGGGGEMVGRRARREGAGGLILLGIGRATDIGGLTRGALASRMVYSVFFTVLSGFFDGRHCG